MAQRPQNPLTARFARQLRERREAVGLSAHDLAARCAAVGSERINREVIANIETGRRQDVTLDEAACLAHVLHAAQAGSPTAGADVWLVSLLADAAQDETPTLPQCPDWMNEPTDWLGPAEPHSPRELAKLAATLERLVRALLRGKSWHEIPAELTWADLQRSAVTYADLADSTAPEA